MRGKPFPFLRVRASSRITPADAGKTCAWKPIRLVSPDHPRGCGENVDTGVEKLEIAGSPPRMRGKPNIAHLTRLIHGITPADAGKTGFLVVRAKQAEDHPRGCGENQKRLFKTGRIYGSPPRMRGKLMPKKVH